jgi:hypothetical protein
MDGRYIYIYTHTHTYIYIYISMFCVSMMMMMIIIIIIDGNDDQYKYCGWKEMCFRLCSFFQTDVANQVAANRLGLESYALFKLLKSLLSNGFFR